MKKDERLHARKTEETIRLVAVDRMLEGESVAVVMDSFCLCRTTCYQWLTRTQWHGRGKRVLRARKGTDRPGKLDEVQKRQVLRWVDGKY